MNEKQLYAAMNGIDDEILKRSEQASCSGKDNSEELDLGKNTAHRHKQIRPSRRLTVILIAAAVAVLLMGAGVVSALYGENIRGWFGYYWEMVTGNVMSEKQTALIDHLSQQIDISQTVEGVTVTVDSVTVGMDRFFLLLRATGLPLSGRHGYGFSKSFMELTPEPLEGIGGLGAWGFEFCGIDGDGAALFLLDYDYVTKQGYVEDHRPLQITLTLQDFAENPHLDRQKVLAEGTWKFTFTIERNEMPQEIWLPDTEVMMVDLTQREQHTEVPVLVKNIRLTNTGIYFEYDYEGGRYDLTQRIQIYVTGSGWIGTGSGSGFPLEESGDLYCSQRWQVPVDLDEVEAVLIGDIKIPVP